MLDVSTLQSVEELYLKSNNSLRVWYSEVSTSIVPWRPVPSAITFVSVSPVAFFTLRVAHPAPSVCGMTIEQGNRGNSHNKAPGRQSRML